MSFSTFLLLISLYYANGVVHEILSDVSNVAKAAYSSGIDGVVGSALNILKSSEEILVENQNAVSKQKRSIWPTEEKIRGAVKEKPLQSIGESIASEPIEASRVPYDLMDPVKVQQPEAGHLGLKFPVQAGKPIVAYWVPKVKAKEPVTAYLASTDLVKLEEPEAADLEPKVTRKVEELAVKVANVSKLVPDTNKSKIGNRWMVKYLDNSNDNIVTKLDVEKNEIKSVTCEEKKIDPEQSETAKPKIVNVVDNPNMILPSISNFLDKYKRRGYIQKQNEKIGNADSNIEAKEVIKPPIVIHSEQQEASSVVPPVIDNNIVPKDPITPIIKKESEVTKQALQIPNLINSDEIVPGHDRAGIKYLNGNHYAQAQPKQVIQENKAESEDHSIDNNVTKLNVEKNETKSVTREEKKVDPEQSETEESKIVNVVDIPNMKLPSASNFLNKYERRVYIQKHNEKVGNSDGNIDAKEVIKPPIVINSEQQEASSVVPPVIDKNIVPKDPITPIIKKESEVTKEALQIPNLLNSDEKVPVHGRAGINYQIGNHYAQARPTQIIQENKAESENQSHLEI